MKNNRLRYTLITGASQGLGKSFAIVCAKKGHNLILVSLPDESISLLAKDLALKYNVDVRYYETNLVNVENVTGLLSLLANYDINILINNAGVGGVKEFEEASMDYLDNMFLLNVRALVILTHQLLPQLKRLNKQAFILNISSLAAFSPLPFKTIYPASKSFVYSFSRSLYEELKDSKIHVSVAHPGGMMTNRDVSQRINSQNSFVKLSILSPDETAEICMTKLLNMVPVIVPGRLNKIGSLMQRILPVSYQMKLIKRKVRKELAVK